MLHCSPENFPDPAILPGAEGLAAVVVAAVVVAAVVGGGAVVVVGRGAVVVAAVVPVIVVVVAVVVEGGAVVVVVEGTLEFVKKNVKDPSSVTLKVKCPSQAGRPEIGM